MTTNRTNPTIPPTSKGFSDLAGRVEPANGNCTPLLRQGSFLLPQKAAADLPSGSEGMFIGAWPNRSGDTRGLLEAENSNGRKMTPDSPKHRAYQ